MKTVFLNLLAIAILTFSFTDTARGADILSGDSLRIKHLLDNRMELIQNNSSTKSVDRELFSLGHLPSACVKKEVNDQTVHFNFPIYKEIREENKDRFTGRVISVYPEIKDLSIDLEKDYVDVLFTNDVTEEQLNSFFKIFGYQGYELKK